MGRSLECACRPIGSTRGRISKFLVFDLAFPGFVLPRLGCRRRYFVFNGTQNRTQHVTNLTPLTSTCRLMRRLGSKDLQRHDQPRTINAAQRFGRDAARARELETYPDHLVHPTGNARPAYRYLIRRTAARYAHSSLRERFASISGACSIERSGEIGWGLRGTDRTPTPTDATWTQLNATETQHWSCELGLQLTFAAYATRRFRSHQPA